ncbi:elongation factor G [Syntrophobacter fumaroxidans]|uniref:Elongation factor G n=1 Tax=Syntrophobacter fumaroxidans (strain DSM 10017 / MPOB) TaxID=335543 RepID=A0LM10_SYNFM|nr:elongation factor G [Syntrophobacter fumaroxidans]ABK18462.1 translation elongation factor 2 (EF-2/EF-G) [Syntrophobacter fumaroxidans MPOB]
MFNGDLTKLRNIGISAHIDSGKTTLTERILFYTQRIHAIHDVKGKDGVGATMDFMELEKERGITIQSAATHCTWNGHSINIIDTPGHVDFTIEVERALRVLDGAVLVLCAVGGVQSQSVTVDRQMVRYKVPRLAFINKCDRTGADPFRVTRQLKEKLNHNAVLLQIPLGLENEHRGIIDLITMKAVSFEGPSGENLVESEIPADLIDLAREKREELLDAASMFSDDLTAAILDDKVTEELIHDAVRAGTLSLQLTPVLVGSAYKNKGVQLLLDAVVRYLPNPMETTNDAFDLDRDEAPVVLRNAPDQPMIMLAFKLEVSRYGQLTYVRIYQGRLTKGDTIVNMRTGKRSKVGRLIRMHADEMEDIESAVSGNIVALFGIDCASGDTFTDGRVRYAMTSIHVPAPVISLAIKPRDKKAEMNMSKALARFTKEDPTFRTYLDDETNETIVCGMGELHLDVYVERMRREYQAEVETGMPKVAYRETVTHRAEFNHTHKKQTGGAGQYGRVAGFLEPYAEGDFNFVNNISGGAIPTEYIPSCEKGFQACLVRGGFAGFPVVGVQVTINDGAAHSVDSSDMAFQQAAVGAFREAYARANPIILEPIMRVVVETPSEYQGAVLGTLNQRRGMIVSTSEDGVFSSIESEVPLAEMFGYSTVLRSSTQGKAEFTMEFARYNPVPKSIAEEIARKQKEEEKTRKK